MQKITTFLTFDNRAGEALEYYASVFKDFRILTKTNYTDAGPGVPGTFMIGEAELAGQRFVLLNGGPGFKFEMGISLLVSCEDQEEIDHYWNHLSDGGKTLACGWLQDKFGVYWQVAPPILGQLLGDKDRGKAQKVMEAMMQMTKIDIQLLKDAYDKG